ncbi:uncharacterized protein LOC127864782 [Dreissena polymorpha]|nr:uncharacterized protein LOC127864782 [Dreissena polymorpha]
MVLIHNTGMQVLLVLSIFSTCTGLMCYFCSDTSNEAGKNSCQSWVKSMRYFRKKYNEKGVFDTTKYVKNCTGFADLPEEQITCGIFSTQSRGLMRSFIRDCSDGKSFYDTSLNEQFENRLMADNQTSCVYKGTSDIVCITLCKDNFCNGPLLSSTSTIESLFALHVLAAFTKYWL